MDPNQNWQTMSKSGHKKGGTKQTNKGISTSKDKGKKQKSN